MDWFTWLSEAELDPSCAYEYALTFTHNELGEDDIPYFSHEFLQSMGVSIAKHRLEILKLAKKRKGRTIHPILWFLFTIKQTKNFLAKHVQALVHHENRALSLVPKRNPSLRWRVSMLQRNNRSRAVAQPPSAKTEWPMLRSDGPRFEPGPRMLMLTDGNPVGDSQSSGSSQSSTWVESEANGESNRVREDALANPWNSSFSSNMVHSIDGEFWSSSTEEIKWDSMFQNLKPT